MVPQLCAQVHRSLPVACCRHHALLLRKGRFICARVIICCGQEMIDEADRDGDGEVNEEEFFRIMKKTTLF